MLIIPSSKHSSVIILASLLILILGIFIGFQLKANLDIEVGINSFEECAAAGYPIMESYPEQCKTPDGRTFTRDISGDNPDQQVACTLDAKLCPDGSAVGRIPPTCEFAPCPGE